MGDRPGARAVIAFWSGIAWRAVVMYHSCVAVVVVAATAHQVAHQHTAEKTTVMVMHHHRRCRALNDDRLLCLRLRQNHQRDAGVPAVYSLSSRQACSSNAATTMPPAIYRYFLFMD